MCVATCQSSKSTSTLGTVHSQSRRCLLARDINIYRRKWFILHLMEFIVDTTKLGREIILTVCSNEHMVKGKLTKQLRNARLIEAYFNKFKIEGTNSYFRDKHQIDGVSHARNIVSSSVAIFHFHFGAGDHRNCTIDFQVSSIIGELALPLRSPNK